MVEGYKWSFIVKDYVMHVLWNIYIYIYMSRKIVQVPCLETSHQMPLARPLTPWVMMPRLEGIQTLRNGSVRWIPATALPGFNMSLAKRYTSIAMYNVYSIIILTYGEIWYTAYGWYNDQHVHHSMLCCVHESYACSWMLPAIKQTVFFNPRQAPAVPKKRNHGRDRDRLP